MQLRTSRTAPYLTALLLLLSSALSAGTVINPANRVESISVYYKTVSYQEPWQNPSAFHLNTKVIHAGKNLLFGKGLPNAIPLFAVTSRSAASRKLQLESYDPETGFMLLRTDETGEGKAVHYRKKTGCTAIYKNKLFYTAPGSSTPLPAYAADLPEKGFVFHNTEFCGLAVDNALVPVHVIRYFITHRKKNGSVFPHAGFEYKKELSSSELLYYFKGNKSGVIVDTVYSPSGRKSALMTGDALVSVNNTALTAAHDIDFFMKQLLIGHDRLQTSAVLGIIREGKYMTINHPLTPFRQNSFLIPENTAPRYLIAGGIVFTELSGAYIREAGQKDHKLAFLYDKYRFSRHPFKSRIIIVSRVLADEKNTGYHAIENQIVERFNGKILTGLNDLKEEITKTTETFSTVELGGGKKIILNNSEIPATDDRIRNNYKIKKLDNLLPVAREDEIDAEDHSLGLDL